MGTVANTSKKSDKMDRRNFIQKIGAGLAGLILLPQISKAYSFSAISAPSVVNVFALRAIPGIKYSRADLNHFAHKIYPSQQAALDRLPHRGLRYRVEPIQMETHCTLEQLFAGRKDIDTRVKSDQQHLRKFGLLTTDFRLK